MCMAAYMQLAYICKPATWCEFWIYNYKEFKMILHSVHSSSSMKALHSSKMSSDKI